MHNEKTGASTQAHIDHNNVRRYNSLIAKIDDIVQHKNYDQVDNKLISEIESCIKIYEGYTNWDEATQALNPMLFKLKDIHMMQTHKNSKYTHPNRATESSPTASIDTQTFTPTPQHELDNTPSTSITPTTEDDTYIPQPPIICSNKPNQLPQVKPTPSKSESTHLIKKKSKTKCSTVELKSGIFTKVSGCTNGELYQRNSTKPRRRIVTQNIKIHQTISEIIRKLDYPNHSHTDARRRYDYHNARLRKIAKIIYGYKGGPKKDHYASLIVILDSVVAATQEYDIVKDEIDNGRTSKLVINQIQETALNLERNIAVLTELKDQYQALRLGKLTSKIHKCTQSALTNHHAILRKVGANHVQSLQIKPAAWR